MAENLSNEWNLCLSLIKTDLRILISGLVDNADCGDVDESQTVGHNRRIGLAVEFPVGFALSGRLSLRQGTRFNTATLNC